MKRILRLLTVAVVFLSLLAGVSTLLGPTQSSACILVEFCSSSADCALWCPSGSGDCLRVGCKKLCVCDL